MDLNHTSGKTRAFVSSPAGCSVAPPQALITKSSNANVVFVVL